MMSRLHIKESESIWKKKHRKEDYDTCFNKFWAKYRIV